ncbi:uncharacterized protein BP01DRAFT_366271 [Aspergillus saccharolyticus JOP 1030-1]|uniref:Uncharacterized protein n=1 Tax=Aspergillus saccharolyticus JOP 1030-1 TaxID=1450539 RepID=A0A318ZBP4_9EURO|nr:hypothetical protein BP01DRAFT_366271 [Aspergillus saccharolyticus JOP 1030-1]PYH44729.1 hypothetical protein BP01DRAFT_366271 [Aspergillus saccharolyticus JOP 1030-1]
MLDTTISDIVASRSSRRTRRTHRTRQTPRRRHTPPPLPPHWINNTSLPGSVEAARNPHVFVPKIIFVPLDEYTWTTMLVYCDGRAWYDKCPNSFDWELAEQDMLMVFHMQRELYPNAAPFGGTVLYNNSVRGYLEVPATISGHESDIMPFRHEGRSVFDLETSARDAEWAFLDTLQYNTPEMVDYDDFGNIGKDSDPENSNEE